jgi:hypothetical protein
MEIEVQGLSEEIAKREFATWPADEISKFVRDWEPSAAILQQPTRKDLLWCAGWHELKKAIQLRPLE